MRDQNSGRQNTATGGVPSNERPSGRCATSAWEGECQAYELRRKRQAVEYQEAMLVVSSSRRAIRKTPDPFVFPAENLMPTRTVRCESEGRVRGRRLVVAADRRIQQERL